MNIIHREFLNTKTESCHASTIAFYNGIPIYAWFGGVQEGLPDSSIYVQVKNKVHKIHSGGIAMWNPVLFVVDEKLYMFYKQGIWCDRWQTKLIDLSNILDDKFKFNESRDLPAGLNGCVKCKPIIIEDKIFCPSSVETIFNWSSWIEIYNKDLEFNKFYSVRRLGPFTVPTRQYEDNLGNKLNSLGIIQPSLWVNDGKINAFFKSSYGLGKIYHTYADLNDMKFIEPYPTKFDNPNSSVDCVFMNGFLYLVYNPSTKKRIPLVINKLDKDFNIVDEIVINEKVSAMGYSYPFMIENERKLHLVYTHLRKNIEYCIIET